jgi:flagellar basal body-associated protein FliL
MQQCLRCGSGVPDGRDTCQICKAPMIPAAGAEAEKKPFSEEEIQEVTVGIPGIDNTPPAANPYGVPAQPGLGGQVRVSLTGEVVEVPPPTPQGPRPGAPIGMPPGARPPAGAGSPVPPLRPVVPPVPGAPPPPGAGTVPPMPSGPATMRPGPVTPARMSYPRGAYSETAPKKSGGVVIAIVVLLVLMAAGVVAGFWFYQQQRAPAVAVEQFMMALQKKDWKGVYAMLDIPDNMKGQLSESQFTQAMQLVGNMITIKQFKVGKVTREGDTASVELTVTVEMSSQLAALSGGQSGEQVQNTSARLKNVNGQWKIPLDGLRSAMGSVGTPPGGRGR